MSVFKKIDDFTLQVSDPLTDSTADWGAPRLKRLFNFRARQVTTIYERGGLKDFTLPGNGSVSSKAGYSAAVTSSMQIQNFRDIEGDDEIAAMHRELVRLGGKPPALEDVLPRVSKKSPVLKG